MNTAMAPGPMLPNGTAPNGPTPNGNTSPAAVAPDDAGKRAEGEVIMGVGLAALEKGLSLYGTATPEGKAIVEALGKLSKVLGKPAPDLGMQELQMLMAMQTGKGQGTAQEPVAAVPNQVQDKLSGMGMTPAAK